MGDSMQPASCGLKNISGSRKKYVLFRFPKDMKLDDLDGVSITLPSDNDSQVLKDGHEKLYIVNKDASYLYSRFRPIYECDDASGHGTVGDAFGATYSITHNIEIGNNDASNKAVVKSYTAVPQIQGLTVRSLPFGSTTDIKDLRNKLAARGQHETSVKSPPKMSKKKRKIEENIDKKTNVAELKSSCVASSESSDTPKSKTKKHKRKSSTK
mmetsp:Transcript_23954/g.35164  ORF Transcript_23954/g.35164 Transcript_23954/m.35164 type:complete len:212 (-) Transcript_23954:100-735(-)|eukprot:CAMPEP_0185021832 /NCGR_PEP_ID=MMETSP1103-20130426/4540_1 /TAXON_ID=36769 /ORGANISM="Paraphysomonas bandaiensis, Strain Caron Lab Isolate" /LENGTH=211 /DNA_ID=CAMNT_0027553593 /DNA_START=1 /DNA_END=636 /DNA_ORIENTATION=+